MERSIETKLTIHYKNIQLAKMKLELIGLDPIWTRNPDLKQALLSVDKLQTKIAAVCGDVMRNG